MGRYLACDVGVLLLRVGLHFLDELLHGSD